MENKKSIFNMIKTISFYTITLFLFAYVAVSLFIPDKVIDIFGFQVTSISRLTESMKPTIEPGDIILLKRISEDDIKEDDVISFFNYTSGTNQDNEEVWVKIRIVHRLIEIDDNGAYITAGDNNKDDNGNIKLDIIYDENGEIIDLTYDQVIGAYVFRVPFVGTIISGLRNPILVGLLIVNVGIVVLIIKLVKKKDEPEIKEGEDQ